MNLTKTLCIALSATALSSHAAAQEALSFEYDEIEPNDSLLAPQVIPPFPIQSYGDFGTLFVSSSLAPGDVDFFQVHFSQTVLFGAFGAESPPGAHPSLIGQFDADGTPIEVGEGIISGTLLPGTYTFAFTGIADVDFTGNHSQTFSYTFILDWVALPVPGTMIALGIAGLLGRSRRR